MSETSKTQSSVKFSEKPPPGRVQRYDWEAIAKKLRRKPGEWGLIFKGDLTSLVVAIRHDDIKALRKDKGFEVMTANNKRGKPRTCDLWLRYVPENDKEKARASDSKR